MVKLLLFPFIIFEQIIKVLQLVEVFELSLTSARVLYKIKFVKRKLQPLQLLISKKRYAIGLQEFKITHEKKFSPTLLFSFKKENNLNTFPRRLTVSGFNFNVSKNEWTFSGPYDFDCLYPIFSYLFNLFSIDSAALAIECTKITDELLSHPMFAPCSCIDIINEKTNVMTNRQVSILLKHMNPKYGIAITCQVSSNFKQHKNLFNLPSFSVVAGEWITFDTLLNASGGRIKIESHNFTERHLKIYIKYWLKRDNQTLYCLRLGNFEKEPKWEDLLEGIAYTKWDEKRRCRYYRTTTTYANWFLDCEDGWDFERKDGKLATVLHSSNYFYMLVWHDRFPKMH
ncbi:unnamed protein product [Caenorhabditis brenneri]